MIQIQKAFRLVLSALDRDEQLTERKADDVAYMAESAMPRVGSSQLFTRSDI